MANKKETQEERVERVSKELEERYTDEAKAVTDAAAKARKDAPQEEGFQNWDQYWEHAANVPGVFGDTDTSGTSPSTDSVVSKNEEIGGLDVAAVDAAQDKGDEDAEDVTDAEAKRQLDVAGPQPSAEEVNAGDKKDSKPKK